MFNIKYTKCDRQAIAVASCLLWLTPPLCIRGTHMIIAQSDAQNFDAALNNNGLQPVGPRSVEAFQRTEVDSTNYDLLLIEPRSVQRSHNAHTLPPDVQL